ncbi:MAG: PilZ domain-containing protein [Miltoncostaeaceae bacterium]
MADSSSDRERRVHPRVYADLAARVVADDGTETEARSVNLSEGGVLLSGGDFPDGDTVRIEIELAELGWHSLEAEVIRRESTDGEDDRLAARFAQVATDGGREAIRAFFDAHIAGEGEEPPASSD